ncbi:MAG: O-antigen ligase family protein [Anaerolineales bacterium]
MDESLPFADRWFGTVIKQLAWWLWLGLLVAVPVTSFPLVRNYVGDSSVYPLSALILVFLVLAWLIPYILGDGRFPGHVRPLLLFALLAVLSAGIGLTLPLGPYKGTLPLSRELRALATLGIGVCFYLTAVTLPDSERRIRMSLWALYFGAVLTLIWSSLQAIYVTDNVANIPTTLNRIQRMISVRDLLRNRVSGMAYEPSWLGDQLVVLYLPLWLGSVLTRYSAFTRRRTYLSIELILLGWGTAILVMARSRISMLSLIVMVGVLYVLLARGASHRLAHRIRPNDALARTRLRGAVFVSALLVGVLGIVGAGYGLVKVGSAYDWRLRRVLQVPNEMISIRQQHPYAVAYELANRVAFAERLVYWRTAFSAFEAYPVFGVGPGDAGFLFQSSVPAYGYTLTEIQAVLRPNNPTFPNPKNLWIRLLAETGLIGFSAYLAWILVMAGCAWSLFARGDGLARTLGLVGVLAMAAQLVEGFSLDTFALPQIWLVNGLITTAYVHLLVGIHTGRSPDLSGRADQGMLESGSA